MEKMKFLEKRKRFLGISRGLFAFLCLLWLSAVAAYCSPDVGRLLSTQQELENEINTLLDNLIAQSKASTESSLKATEHSKSALSEAGQLKTERSDLSTSSDDISRSLNESKTRIIELSLDLRFWKKACVILASILMALCAAVGLVLYLELTHKTNFI